MEKRALGGGCRRLRGRFSIPQAERAICLCAHAAEVGDSHRAPTLRRSAPDGRSGCAGRAFSRHGRGYAFCRIALLQWRDMCCRHLVHRAREEPRSTVRVAVWITRERQVPAHARSWRAIAVGLRRPALRSRGRTATPLRSERQGLAVLLTRHGDRLRRCAALRASHHLRGGPGQPQDRATAETLRH